jgi:hypothetical protein
VRPSNSILRRISIICPSFNGITPSFSAYIIEAIAVFSRGFQSKNIVIPDDRISGLEDLRRTSGMRPTSWDPHLHQYRHYLLLIYELNYSHQLHTLSAPHSTTLTVNNRPLRLLPSVRSCVASLLTSQRTTYQCSVNVATQQTTQLINKRASENDKATSNLYNSHHRFIAVPA